MEIGNSLVAHVRHRGDRPPFSGKNDICGLSIKGGETRNSCLLSVENLNGSRHLVFWSLETLTGLRDQVRRLVA